MLPYSCTPVEPKIQPLNLRPLYKIPFEPRLKLIETWKTCASWINLSELCVSRWNLEDLSLVVKWVLKDRHFYFSCSFFSCLFSLKWTSAQTNWEKRMIYSRGNSSPCAVSSWNTSTIIMRHIRLIDIGWGCQHRHSIFKLKIFCRFERYFWS
jgi:hypothetical protein